MVVIKKKRRKMGEIEMVRTKLQQSVNHSSHSKHALNHIV